MASRSKPPEKIDNLAKADALGLWRF
jgi:hypothetical protein